MKCYTIQSSNGEYIGDSYRNITTNYWEGATLCTSPVVEEAKHFRNASQPKAWIAKTMASMQATHDEYKEKYREAKLQKSYSIEGYKRKYESARAILSWLEGAKVVDIEVEKANFDVKHKIVWDKWRVHRGNQGKSLLKLQVDSHSRYTCKCCGLKLKNVPYYELLEGNPTKICIPCLYIRMDAIKSAFEGMPEEFRTNIVNELILGAM